MSDSEARLSPEESDRLIHEAATLRTSAARWKRIHRLHSDGGQEVLQAALSLLRSPDPRHRARGADILGQLGWRDGKAYWRESVGPLVGVLQLPDEPSVLESAIYALWHLARDHGEEMPEAAGPMIALVTHPTADVRHALAYALTGLEAQDERVVDALITLTKDRSPSVRDWATFGLGTKMEADTPRIRAALAARLGDRHEGTRWEAIAGLAKRHDHRVLETVREAILSGMDGVQMNVVGTIIASVPGYRDPRLCLALSDVAHTFDEALADDVREALAECQGDTTARSSSASL